MYEYAYKCLYDKLIFNKSSVLLKNNADLSLTIPLEIVLEKGVAELAATALLFNEARKHRMQDEDSIFLNQATYDEGTSFKDQ